MKTILAFLLFGFCCFAPLACRTTGHLSPTLPFTPTPTVNTTPVCGFTLVPGTVNLLSPGPYYVIQNAAEWSAANPNGTGVTMPPVNFSNQMIVEYSEWIQWNCGCSPIPPSITSVCEYSDHIEVDYQNGGVACPPPAAYTCNSFFSNYFQALAIVPLSNLPVSWVKN